MAKILIVDDRPLNLEYIRTVLASKDHAVVSACDGAEAFAEAQRQPPDLIISDILMPMMDGYELVRRIRAEDALRRTPVIFLTAHYLEREALALSKAAGVEHVLSKPIEPEALLAVVERVLSEGATDTAPCDTEFDRWHSRLLGDSLQDKADELESSHAKLKTLVALSTEIACEPDPDLVLGRVCREARRLVSARYVGVGIRRDEESGGARFWMSGIEGGTVSAIAPPSGIRTLFASLLDRNAPARSRNPAMRAVDLGLPPSVTVVHDLLAVPIGSGSTWYGVLFCTQKIGSDEFTADDESLAKSLSAQLGMAYENALRRHATERLAAMLQIEAAARQRAEDALRERIDHLQPRGPVDAPEREPLFEVPSL